MTNRTLPSNLSPLLLCSILLGAAPLAVCATGADAAGAATVLDRADDQRVAAKPAVNEFPADWFWGNERQRRAQDAMIGRRAPELVVDRWVGEPVRLAALRGKVVVVDFWATWCGPCIRAMPMNKKLIEEYADDGLVFIGVHDHRRGLDRLEAVMEEHAVTYPVAVDDDGKSARSWNLAFWPTYGVVDREGMVRAVGLRPERVADVVRTLIAEPIPADLRDRKDAPPNADPEAAPKVGVSSGASSEGRPESSSSATSVVLASPLPSEWIERMPEARAPIEALIGRPAPPLPTDGEWINARPLCWEDLRGKVVLLDFWATWCAPCIQAIPELNALQDRYRRHGLVVIGICHERGAERMAEVARQSRIRYPIVADNGLATIRAYRVDTYPDYYLVDRAGRVRGVDLRTEKIELAIKRLLAE